MSAMSFLAMTEAFFGSGRFKDELELRLHGGKFSADNDVQALNAPWLS